MIAADTRRNLFPSTATLNLASTSTGGESDGQFADAPTLPLPWIKEALHYTSEFLKRIEVGAKWQGRVVVLQGEHGCGKTHTIYYVKAQAAAGNLSPRPDSPLPVQLYALADGPNFLKVYEGLFDKDLSFEALRDAARRFQAVIAGEEVRREMGEGPILVNAEEALRASEQDPKQSEPFRGQQITGKELVDKLRANPDNAERLFKTSAVEQGLVAVRQYEEVTYAADKENKDFQNALSFLTRPSPLAKAAYNWLTLKPLSDNDMKKLGVSGAISSADGARSALRLITTVFRRAGIPLILYIDQYEKLVMDAPADAVAQNISLLRFLFEDVAQEGGMLFLAGDQKAWPILHLDVRERASNKAITLPSLTIEQAKQIVRLYLQPEELPDIRGVPDDDLLPFSAEAIRQLLEYSSGNIRRFLQACHDVYDKALLQERRIISGDYVKEVAKEIKGLYFTRQTVTEEIERLLLERVLFYERDYSFEGIPSDFAVLYPDGKPRLLIRISKALVSRDENEIAFAHLNLIKKLNEKKIPALFVLVVLGYASEEVSDRLGLFVHRLVIYRSDTFRQRFMEVLDTLPDTPALVPAALIKEREQFEQQMEQLRASFQEQKRMLEERLAQLLERQGLERSGERTWKIRTAWAEERRKIEDQIKQSRAERETKALLELETLRKKGEHDRLQARIIVMGIVLVAFVLSILLSQLFSPYSLYGDLLRIAALVLATVALASLPWLLTAIPGLHSAATRHLSATVTSTEDLERIANVFLRKKRPISTSAPFARVLFRIVGRMSIRALLHHANPNFRYAGALAADAIADERELIFALRGELSSIVRQVLVKKLASGGSSPELLKVIAVSALPEAAYALETVILSHPDQTSGVYKSLPNLPEALRTMDTIYKDSPYDSALALCGAGAADAMVRALATVIDSGLDRAVPTGLYLLPERRMREVLVLLSPLDEGLGTCDALRLIHRVDQLFLLFRQILFLLEHDLFESGQSAENAPIASP